MSRYAIVCGDMPSTIVATELFGRPVAIDGAVERLHDLGIVRVEDSWRVVALRTKLHDASFGAWTPAGLTGTAAEPGAIAASWLREALFDRQIVDLDGRRVTRIGDVVLEHDGERLDVVSVEVGAAAVLRRLGLIRLAARIEPQLVAIERLHFPGPSAGALTLDEPRRRLEELDGDTVAGLLARLPVASADHLTRASRHREAVARATRLRRRRRRFPRTPR